MAVSGSANFVVAQKTAHQGTPDVYLPSLRRSFEELGVRQAIDLQESIKRTLAWFGRYKTARGIDLGY